MLATINAGNQFFWPTRCKSTTFQPRFFVNGEICPTQAASANYAAMPYKGTLNLMLRTRRTGSSWALSPDSKYRSSSRMSFVNTHPKKGSGSVVKEFTKHHPAMVNRSTLMKCPSPPKSTFYDHRSYPKPHRLLSEPTRKTSVHVVENQHVVTRIEESLIGEFCS